jgi:hypothetical protein
VKHQYYVWREGNRLVVEAGAALPNRCVLCNATATTRTSLRFHWTSQDSIDDAAGLSIMTAPLGVAWTAGSSFASVNVGLCARHRSVRIRRTISVWVLSLISVGFFFLPMLGRPFEWGIFAGLFMIPVAYAAFLRRHPLKVVNIVRNQVRITGANEAFLNSLPGGSPRQENSLVDHAADQLSQMQ